MNKKDLHQHCIRHLKAQVDALEAVARETASTSTDAEHIARSKYETFSLESSYLARGQAMRVEEMREALLKITAMTPSENHNVQLGALVELSEPGGEAEWYWLVPAGGGEELEFEGHQINLLSLQSPLAQILYKKQSGEQINLASRTLQILSVH